MLEYKGGQYCRAADNRDRKRLCEFLPIADWEKMGMRPVQSFEVDEFKPDELTRENVLARLENDLEQGFVTAFVKRTAAARLMNEVVKMWLWLLDDPLSELEPFDHFGLPLLIAAAKKYGFKNPCGDDAGSESKYE